MNLQRSAQNFIIFIFNFSIKISSRRSLYLYIKKSTNNLLWQVKRIVFVFALKINKVDSNNRSVLYMYNQGKALEKLIFKNK